MATLQVAAADLSATKKKAVEDADKMQRSIIRECAENGREPPPYALSELIGKGSFGRVYKARASASGQLVAVKIISIDEGDSLAPGAADTFKDILKEVNTLKKLGDSGARNINTVIETLLVGPAMWIITEYCGGGSVSTLMRPSGGLPEKWIIPILREVAEALYWVHKEGIIHRDIKCANVLVTEKGGVQLCDFGVAGIIETKFDKRSTVTGTLNWMAPELFDMSVSYGTEVDIWAFGSLAFEAATGLPPNAKNMARIDIPQFGSYLKQHCPRLEGDQYSEHLKDLVAFCMTEDPRNRPAISQVQRHPYINNTASDYPTQSLSMLVKAYRLWEVQGGNRMSLFNAGGAQGLASNDAPGPSGEDGWNFDTVTGGFDVPRLGDTEAKAVYDAYGPRVSMMPPPPRDSSRRRRPPNIPKLKGPLEKAFDPNTITTYEDNSRLFYGRLMPTSAPEMGMENSDKPATNNNVNEPARESLIDLDLSLDGDRLSRFADMNGGTIKGAQRPKHETIRESGLIDLDMSLDGDRLSRFNRSTREWTFASAVSTNSHLGGEWFQSNEDDDYMALDSLPQAAAAHHHHNNSLEVDLPPRAATSLEVSRFSSSSLIDLDASLTSEEGELLRPSTSLAEPAASETWMPMFRSQQPSFGLSSDASLHSSREPSLYISDDAIPRSNREPSLSISEDAIPMSNREPSLYIGDMSPNGSFSALSASEREPSIYVPDDVGLGQVPSTPTSDGMIMTPPSDTNDAAEELGIRINGERVSINVEESDFDSDAPMPSLPYMPRPPTVNVLQGTGAQDDVKDELQRMIRSLHEHLQYTSSVLRTLPTRPGQTDYPQPEVVL
ncbi:kinase-like protein [Cryphonectria parasitica EP155]|uniref:non-specific serine/threonine protein kinase n=1 Tax=Cryphonectria parasitica (strain ATCC 38755 / EP155) TaxID=660469 RepID=A0A9P5CLL5_CRYP1|nr:kinase-like protein [Cryphonectria parasitica EP155]KAF3762141.1 kinase-like protein [Cryphonectria parasitica EP155]